MLRDRLRRARKDKGLTQRSMADLLDITIGNYQKYENGKARPPVEKLVKIADALDVSIDYLLCRDEFLARQKAQDA